MALCAQLVLSWELQFPTGSPWPADRRVNWHTEGGNRWREICVQVRPVLVGASMTRMPRSSEAVTFSKAEVSLSLLLPEFDARRLSLVILDYIRAWKQVHFAELAVARAAAGGRAQAQASAPEPERTPPEHDASTSRPIDDIFIAPIR